MASDTGGSGSMTIHGVPLLGEWICLVVNCTLCGQSRTHLYRPDTAESVACYCGMLFMLGWMRQTAPLSIIDPN